MIATLNEGPVSGVSVLRLAAIGVRSTAMVHDLNNLLQIVVGNLACVNEDSLDEKASKHLTLARFGLERCARLARRTLKAETGANCVISVSASIKGMIERLRCAAGEGVEIVVDAPDERLAIMADDTDLENALLNLVINASQAMEGRGRVLISCRECFDIEQSGDKHARAGNTVVLSVEDTGPGIPKDLADAVSQRFFTTKAAGSGIGLANVRSFVEGASGAMTIRSEPGSGAVVALSFPRAHVPFRNSARMSSVHEK